MISPVFISYAEADKDVASWLRESLDRLEKGTLDFFVASDGDCIEAGDRWAEKIEDALKEAKTVIVLCSPDSVQRNWVNFEAGGAWLSENCQRIIPVCHSGLSASSLPEPLKSFQGLELDKDGLKEILRLLARIGGIPYDRIDGEDKKEVFANIPVVSQPFQTVPAVIFDDHRTSNIPSHHEVIQSATKSVKVFSTTGASCFLEDGIFKLILEKARAGCKFQFLLLDPASWAIEDRSRQDRDVMDLQTMRNKIAYAITRFELLREKTRDVENASVDLRLYDCGSAFQSLIVDDREMYVAPRVYGIRSTSETPCLSLVSQSSNSGVFQKYLAAFKEVWDYNSYAPSELYDSSLLYRVQYLETWCALNTAAGCSNGCAYCFTKTFPWGRGVTWISTPDSVVDALLRHPLFTRNKTILAIGTKTEPFLPENTEDTLRLLRRIAEEKLPNPLALLTRARIDNGTMDKIEELPQHVAPIFLVTFSGLPSNEFGEPQIADLEGALARLSKRYRLIHAWRPIVPDKNTDEDSVTRVLALASKYCAASVCVGIKYSEDMRSYMQRSLGLDLPGDVTRDQGFGIYLPAEIRDRIASLASELSPGYPVFFGMTSCAMSYLLEQPDYLANRLVYPDRCNASLCPDRQRNVSFRQGCNF